MHHDQRAIRSSGRSVVRASVGIIALTVASLLSTTSAGAAVSPPDQDQIREYLADFTDCGQTASPDCLASQVFARAQKEQLGSSGLNTSTVEVVVFAIHLNPDGSFDIAPIADGVTDVDLKTTALKSASFAATVPESDGTTVTLNMTFTGTGSIDSEVGQSTYPAPLCSTGTATGTLKTDFRTASVNGSVTVHGVSEIVTDAVEEPGMFLGQSTGNCT
jgi:hypothetical protein